MSFKPEKIPVVLLSFAAAAGSFEVTQLTFGEHHDWYPDWSPDGAEVIFSSNRAAGREWFWDLYTVPASGGAVTRLTYTTEDENTPAWSANGAYIYYAKWVPRWQIWRLPAGGEAEPIGENDLTTDEYAPACSPDGSKVALSKTYRPTLKNWDIYTIDAAGGNEVRLTTDPAYDSFPSYSPDGQWIYFSSDRAGVFGIYRVPSVGGTVEPVVVDSSNNLYCDVSPDGGTLAFSSDQSGNWDIWTVPISGGGEPTRITFDDGLDYYPSWSPDGKEITFYSDRAGAFHIFKVTLDDADIEMRSLGKIKSLFR